MRRGIFSISIAGIDFWKRKFNKLARGEKGFVMRRIAEYLLGNESRGLRHYAPQKKVTRKSAYGVTFFSKKQQRAFFAKLKSGEINVPYMRTGAQGKAWHIEGASTKIRLVNKNPSVRWTRGQTRLHAKMGWKTAMETVKSNMKGAIAEGRRAMLEWINRL